MADANHAPSAPAELVWQRGKTRANGVELAWEQTGPADGDPVVLIMGLGCQLIHWPEAFCAGLVQRGFRVLRFDNRDVGLSDSGDRGLRFNIPRSFVLRRLGLPVRANYRLHDMAEDAAQLLDALGIARAHVVGASMGGMIAQLLAATQPQRVKTLTLIMTNPNSRQSPGPSLSLLRRLSSPLKNPTREEAVQRSVRTFELIGSPGFPTPRPERQAQMEAAYDRAYRPGGHLRQMHAIIATGGFEPLLRRIKAPTLVIHGADDPLVPLGGGRRSAKRIAGARLEVIPGMGHDFPAALMPRWVALIAGNAARA